LIRAQALFLPSDITVSTAFREDITMVFIPITRIRCGHFVKFTLLIAAWCGIGFGQSSWEFGDSLRQTSQYSAITYGNDLFVAVFGTGKIFTAGKDLTWTERTNPSVKGLHSILFANGLFVAVGEGGAVITSSDGVSWTGRSSGSAATLACVGFGNGTWVSVGSNGTILTSADASAWESRTSGTACSLYGVTWGGGLFVITGDYGTAPDTNGVILSSPDGVTWTKRQSGVKTTLWPVAYGNGMFVSVNNTGVKASKVGIVIMASSDGIRWEKVAGLINSLQHVIFAHGQFLAVGSNGEVVSSTDCSTWNQWGSGTANQLISAGWGDNRFVVLDKYGTVMTSDDDLATPVSAPASKATRGRPRAAIAVESATLRITLPPAPERRDVDIAFFSLNGKMMTSRRLRPSASTFHVPLAGIPQGWHLVAVRCGAWREGVFGHTPVSR
jgi:hypothetical protein